jgi:hypothetical protein
MSSIRPRHLAIVFALYFGVVAYSAYGYARAQSSAWFKPAISQLVYQTTLIGGVIVLAGLLAVASVLPRIAGPARPTGLEMGSDRGASPTSWSRSRPKASSAVGVGVTPNPEDWDRFLDESDLDSAGYPTSPRRAQNAAAVSAALTRMDDGTTSATGTLIDRLSGIRARDTAMAASEEHESAQTLVRLLEEIKPLLVAAKDAGLDVQEVQRLFSDATVGREGDLAYRVRLVEQMKGTLENALSERVSKELQSLLRALDRSKAMTDQAHGAELIAAEAVALLDTGHYAAAFGRASRARRLLREEFSPYPSPTRWTPAPTSFLALVGPSIAAAAYVAIAAMLLPGVSGFLEANYTLNTGVILFLSYGWLGLILYTISSIYLVSSPPSPRRKRQEFFEDEMDGL